jgi:hypothetical protein
MFSENGLDMLQKCRCCSQRFPFRRRVLLQDVYIVARPLVHDAAHETSI